MNDQLTLLEGFGAKNPYVGCVKDNQPASGVRGKHPTYLDPPGNTLVQITPPFEVAQRLRTASALTGLPVSAFAVSPACAIPVPLVASDLDHPLFRLPDKVLRPQTLPNGTTESKSGLCLRVCVQLDETGTFDAVRRTWGELPDFASDQARLAHLAEQCLEDYRDQINACAAVDFGERLAACGGNPALVASLLQAAAGCFPDHADLFSAAAKSPSDQVALLAAYARLEQISTIRT